MRQYRRAAGDPVRFSERQHRLQDQHLAERRIRMNDFDREFRKTGAIVVVLWIFGFLLQLAVVGFVLYLLYLLVMHFTA